MTAPLPDSFQPPVPGVQPPAFLNPQMNPLINPMATPKDLGID